MELHQLRYLAAIADEGSFTAAAARLHVSQSGVSMQIAKLERELGQALLDRGRSLSFTPAGLAVLPLARDALATVQAIGHTAAEFAQAVRGPVRLGVIPGCTIPRFLDVVAGMRRTHPGIELRLSEGDSEVLLSGVQGGTLDIALTGYVDQPAPGLSLTVVTEDPLVAFSAPAFGLGPVTGLAEVQRHPVLCLSRGGGIRAAYDQSCRRLGLDPRVDIEASSPMTLLGLAQRGGGVAVLPKTTFVLPGLLAAPIEDAAALACLGLVSREDHPSPAVRLVRSELVAALC